MITDISHDSAKRRNWVNRSMVGMLLNGVLDHDLVDFVSVTYAPNGC